VLAEERRELFKSDVANMKLKTGTARRDGLLQGLGALLMVVGVVVGLLMYEASLHQSDSRQIGSEQILAVTSAAVTVVGAALFVTGYLARFLRLWLLRQLYEGQSHIDQVVAALDQRA